MTWFVAICIALFLSVTVNIFLIWYSVKLIRELFDVSSTLEDLFVDIEAFSQHLQGVYELEMFYGDQTLENLLSHARVLAKEFDKYEMLFSLREPTEENRIDRFAHEEEIQA